MKHLLLGTSLFLTLFTPVFSASKDSTVLIHPGEVVYAQFEQKGHKIRLLNSSTEKNDAAQVIFRLTLDEKKSSLILKIENNFAKELSYKLEMRSLTLKKKSPVKVSPVVAQKVAYETFPPAVEEIAAFELELRK